MNGLLLTGLLTAAAQDPASELALEPTPPPVPTKASVRLVYTGMQRGVGSGVYPFLTLGQLPKKAIQSIVARNGVLAQGSWVLWTEGGQVQPLLTLLEAGEVACDAPVSVPMWETTTELVVLAPGGDASAGDIVPASPGSAPLRRCRAGGVEALLLGPGDRDPSWSLADFEFRKALDVSVEGGRLWMLGRPVHEPSRTFARLATLREPGTLFVDAGSFVDGASAVESGALSLHRGLVFETLAGLSPTVLVPGETELIAGPEVFLEEQRRHGLQYMATNWAATDEEMALPGHAMVSVDTPAGPVRVAFVGMLDPELAVLVPELAKQGVTITPPIPGVQATVDALYASDDPPDTVIVLTTASSALMEEARRRLRGVDMMMGDRTFATLRVGTRETSLRETAPNQRAAPLTLSLDGVATAELAFVWIDGEPALDRVITAPQVVQASQAIDPEITARITQTRAKVYPALDDPLLPAFGEDGEMTEAQWNSLICEAVRQSTDADTVFLSTLPPLQAIPGPMTALQLLNHLGMLDVLESRTVLGSSYSALLDRAYGMDDLVACGATAASKTPQGRSIDITRAYRIVSTDRTLNSHRIGPVISSARPARVLDGAGQAVIRNEAGKPARLQAAVLDTLREVRDEGGGPEAIKAWLSAAPSRKPPQWLLQVRQLNVQVSDFQGADNEAFAEVPETLATSPSSFTLGSLADVAVAYSDASVAADWRLRSGFTQLQTEETEDPTETADDLRASSSLSVPAWLLPGRIYPYTELLYDTEWTPTEADDGSLNSRQADLSQTLGVSMMSRGILQSARLGVFANRDMAQLDTKPTEFGGKLDWSTSKAFSSALVWTTTGDVQIYADTPDDDASDLRLRALAESRLSLPLARYLNVSLYAQGFGIRGRSPENAQWGASYTLGASVDVIGAFLL